MLGSGRQPSSQTHVKGPLIRRLRCCSICKPRPAASTRVLPASITAVPLPPAGTGQAADI